MRFFAHDGKTTHGPAEVEELLKLPGFDGDTLVCPVGSADSADWKSALAYPPFKQALLAPKAPPAAAPIPLPLPPPPAVKTSPCKICAHLNPETARYCNACGARVDGSTEPSPAKKSEPVASAPINDPFAPSAASSFPVQPSASFPMPAPAPAPAPVPTRKPPQTGKMGQLAAFEETVSKPLPPLAPSPASEVLISAPSESSAVVKESKNGKSAAIAAVVLAAFVASALAWKKFAPAPRPRKIIAELAPAAPSAPAAQTPAPAPMPTALILPPRPAPRLPPTIKTPPKAAEKNPAATKRKRVRGARARKSEPPPAPRAAAAKQKQPAAESELEALLANATPEPEAGEKPPEKTPAPAAEAKPAPPPAKKEPAAETKRFSLPGLDRPISPGERKPKRLDSEPNPAAAAGSPAPPAEAPAAAAPAEAGQAEEDQLALAQVKEQFDFCTQLLAQSAYGDHYDTCLCKDTRRATKRAVFVETLKKSKSAGKLENTAKITSSSIAGGTATLVAHWRVLPNEFGRDVTQSWRLEDGLWCRAP